MTSAVRLNPSIADRLRAGDEHIVVTGATGWLGLALTHALAEALGKDCATRLHLFSSSANTVALENGTSLPTQPLETLGTLAREHSYYVFHFAFLTKDKQGTMPLEMYAQKNRAIRDYVGSFLTSHTVRGLCVTSSGAVYTKTRELNRDLQAYPYAALKVEEEEYFTQICQKQHIPLIIPRIFNMSGPYINKWSAYALSSLLAMAIRGEKLTINARHSVIRSYCAISDVVQVLMGALWHKHNTNPLVFDIASPETIEIGALAEQVCSVTGRNVSDISRIFDANLPADHYCGDSTVFLGLCQQFGIAPMPLREQIVHTADYMRGLHLAGAS